MSNNETTPRKPLRLWPGAAIAVLMVLTRLIAPLFPDGTLLAVVGPLAGGALIFLWWLLFSRARWTERLAVLAVFIVAGIAAYLTIHPSIRGGFMGRMFPFFFGIPGLALALVVWAVAARRLESRARYAVLAAIVLVTCGLFVALRTDGILGGIPQLAWRWTPTAEDRLLAQARTEPAPAAAAPAPATLPTAAPSTATPAGTNDPAAAPSAAAATKTVEVAPLVVGAVVVVATSGALGAFDRGTGDRRWIVKSSGGSYSSPHLVTVGGVQQILLLAGSGLTSVAPADGTVLWRNLWEGIPIVQPNVTGDGDILFTSSDAMGGYGARRLAVARGADGWKVEERWTSNGLKPYFNDYVVHNGHAYGFDGNILACIDLADGKRKWKGGRYGNGQVLLLADQDVLLVISEEGELALVKAAPDQFTELAAKLPAIEGKTWNHPVLLGDLLLVRNGQEMAAFRLPLARGSTE